MLEREGEFASLIRVTTPHAASTNRTRVPASEQPTWEAARQRPEKPYTWALGCGVEPAGGI